MTGRTVFTILEETAARYPEAPALYQPYLERGERKHRVYTWGEYKRAAQEIAAGLRRLGVSKGQTVALDSETRAEFYLADLGIMAGGFISAALYPSYPPAELARTLRACGASAVFVDTPATLNALRPQPEAPSGVPWILLSGEAEGALTLAGLREEGRRAMEADPGLMERIRAEVKPEDPAILYLTSGATGEPKMALTPHAAPVANMDMGPEVLRLGPEDAMVAFLPSAHIAQRVVMELVPIRCGTPVWFVESLTQLPAALKSVRPTALLAPPRLWERIYASVRAEVQKRPPTAQKLFHRAVGLGLRAKRLEEDGRTPPAWMRALLELANRVMFDKIRERFGGRLKVAISGAAPLGRDLANFYQVVGIPLVEGYGLTEGGIVSLNPLERPKAGSIGKALPGVEVRLAEDGELLVRSGALFSRYRNDPRATADVLRDGWLHTGDLARMDEEGYLYITGRKKELIISSSGKKIYPYRIESLFQTEPLINNVILVGDRLPYLTALFSINTAALDSLKGAEQLRGKPMKEIAAAPPVVAEVRSAVARVNRQLAPFEQIRKYEVLDRDLTIEQGELTATMKIRRRRVLDNHRERIAALYSGREDLAKHH